MRTNLEKLVYTIDIFIIIIIMEIICKCCALLNVKQNVRITFMR